MTQINCAQLAIATMVASSLVLGAAPCIAQEQQTEQVAEVNEEAKTDALHSEMRKFIGESSVYLDNRYRFENVDQDGLPHDANASTLRTRLGLLSGEVFGFTSKLEIENVTQVGNSSYNDTINGETDYPVVVDPDGTEVNEAYLQYKAIPNTVLTGGRQALKLDDLRFVGDVGWRQNNQTMDGANIQNTSIDDLSLFYGFVGNVNRIFGEDSDMGDLTTKVHLVNIAYTGIEQLQLTTYAYLLDIEDADALSSATYGVRAHGASPLSDALKLLYDVQYAYQQDYADNPVDYDAHYYHAQTGVSLSGVVAKVGYESLGSDDGQVAFSTPLATLHKWNGWADKFLNTPEQGLEDAYAMLGYTLDTQQEIIQKLAFKAFYHYFSAEENSTKYGSEWDLELVATLCPILSVGVKYANYDAANFAADTEKLIFTLHMLLN